MDGKRLVLGGCDAPFLTEPRPGSSRAADARSRLAVIGRASARICVPVMVSRGKAPVHCEVPRGEMIEMELTIRRRALVDHSPSQCKLRAPTYSIPSSTRRGHPPSPPPWSTVNPEPIALAIALPTTAAPHALTLAPLRPLQSSPCPHPSPRPYSSNPQSPLHSRSRRRRASPRPARCTARPRPAC